MLDLFPKIPIIYSDKFHEKRKRNKIMTVNYTQNC